MQDKVGEYLFCTGFGENQIFCAEIVGTFRANKDCVLVRGDMEYLSIWHSDSSVLFNRVGDCTVIEASYIIGKASSLMKELI